MNSARRRGGNISLLPLYLGIVGTGGILTHLAAEIAGIGREAGSTLFGAVHVYLLLTAAFLSFMVYRSIAHLWRSSSSALDFKRALNIGLGQLPFAGRGPKFALLTTGLQLAFALSTELGEGCSVCGDGHHAFAAALGAIVTVIVLSLAGRAIGRRLPKITQLLLQTRLPLGENEPWRAHRRVAPDSFVYQLIWPAELFNRPPPLLQS